MSLGCFCVDTTFQNVFSYTPVRVFKLRCPCFINLIGEKTAQTSATLAQICSCSLRRNHLKVQHTKKFQLRTPTPILEAHKSTTLYISTTDAISQKFQTTGA